MHQENVISQLLAWIEQSLDQPLTLDSIAAKSGYSKWHLQRMFKRHTGEVLGTYVRRRRLTAAARELRLTSVTVVCIADKYQFDSQQTFTRSFKKQFGVPPATYRRSADWPGDGLQPPLDLARLHDTAIAQMNAVRRPGQDIERFSPALGVCYGDDRAAIGSEYLIPIRRAEEGCGLR